MNALAAAIYTKLAADGTLTAMLATTTSIYENVAPQDAARPYVIFGKQAGTPHFTMSGIAHREFVYRVKAVTESPAAAIDREPAGDIAARIETVLTDTALTISGHTHLKTRPSGDIDYDEMESSRVYHHVGALYRIRSA